MKNLLFVIAFMASTLLFGQSFQITGKVVTEDNTSIPFANVLLLNATDSTFVKGTSADDNGTFTLTDIVPDLYLLQASYLGNGSKPLALDVRKDIKLGALRIPETVESLEEVTVTAKKPVVQRLADRLVFDVENTVVSQGSSWDILKGTPGVIVNQSNLQIRGQNASVYMNDRKVQLSGQEVQDLLEGLSGVNIKSVEVIPNPPARYDAESGPILNIVTSKNILPGYKGSVNSTFTQGVFSKYNLGTSQYYKTEKLNIFANYTYNPRKDNIRSDQKINFIDGSNAVFSRWDTDQDAVKRSQPHSLNTALDYAIDDKNTLSLTTNLLFNQNQDWQRTLQTDIQNGLGQLDSTFTTDNGAFLDKNNLAFDLSYVRQLKKPGAQLSFNGHYTNYRENLQQSIFSEYVDVAQNPLRNFGFRTDALQDIDIITGQVDFSMPLGSSSMETGAKISVINSESSIGYSNFLGTDPNVNAGLSDDFLYDENIYAAYLSWVKNWDKWSLKLGVRGEYTDALGTSLTLGETNVQQFFEPFPTAYLLYAPSEAHSFSFDYGRNVERPRYNDLNPFRFFFNENSFQEGNPRLQPNFSHNFNVNYTWNSEFFFDVYYRENGRYISELSFQDNTALTLRELRQNVLSSTSYGLDFTVSKSIVDAWFLYAYTSLFYEDETFLAVESGNQEFTNQIEGFYVYLANYLTLSGDGSLTGELTFTHMSNYLFGSYVQGPTTNLTLGLRKSFWEDRAVVSLSAEDLLGKANPRYTSRYLNQDNSFFAQPETQFIRLGFTYNFGNFRLEDNQKAIDKKERERLEPKE
ncbi:TonB-dependent receptor [Croceitalea dokdonensis DOKDO 023]|uniref:TonB-dependent receptor n=1 Tax=Croceitalea dokdonensis DOKDO 023 TaxID=1300341 RepID=A0A0P7ACE6_9FLAO|nr:outer membrane beta-barrel family protein [Croceitalea dokdonensis]KPM30898.1 TonB-dependent receptor [Croceitalea dokdonensis DOKDO 023]